MPDPATDHRALLRRWESLASADREAILEALPDDRRLQLEALLAEFARNARPDRQYDGYSSWLANLIEACVEVGGREAKGACSLPDAVQASLRRTHHRLQEEHSARAIPGGPFRHWRGSLRSMAGLS